VLYLSRIRRGRELLVDPLLVASEASEFRGLVPSCTDSGFSAISLRSRGRCVLVRRREARQWALRPSDIRSVQVSKPTASIVRGSTATIRTVDGEVKLVCVDPDGLETSIKKILG